MVGKRISTLNIQLDADDDSFAVVIGGNTWAFRSQLDAIGAPGAYVTGENDSKSYLRVLKDLKASDDAAVSKVVNMVTNIFHNLAHLTCNFAELLVSLFQKHSRPSLLPRGCA